MQSIVIRCYHFSSRTVAAGIDYRMSCFKGTWCKSQTETFGEDTATNHRTVIIVGLTTTATHHTVVVGATANHQTVIVGPTVNHQTVVGLTSTVADHQTVVGLTTVAADHHTWKVVVILSFDSTRIAVAGSKGRKRSHYPSPFGFEGNVASPRIRTAGCTLAVDGNCHFLIVSRSARCRIRTLKIVCQSLTVYQSQTVVCPLVHHGTADHLDFNPYIITTIVVGLSIGQVCMKIIRRHILILEDQVIK